MTKEGHLITGLGLSLLAGYDPIVGTFGAIFPDYDLIIAKLFGTWKTNKKRRLLTAHRGITHHFLLIPILVFVCIALKDEGKPEFLFSSFAFGYTVHLFGDLLTPLGLPYRFSYYPRLSYPVFTTGSWKEYAFLFFFSVATGYLILSTGSINALTSYLFSLPTEIAQIISLVLNRL